MADLDAVKPAHSLQQPASDSLRLVARVAAAYVSGNAIAVTELPGLIKSIHGAFASLALGSESATTTVRTEQKPAVPVKKSVTNEYIICLEDGKKLKMLKRYLRSKYSLTPEEYRLKWGLPADYPMVAPNYAALRSAFAKKIGLGRNSPAHKGRKRR